MTTTAEQYEAARQRWREADDAARALDRAWEAAVESRRLAMRDLTRLGIALDNELEVG